MLDDVLKIKSIGIDQVLKDPANMMLLLRIYSKLFLGGKQPSNCNSCIRKYYKEITLKGIEMAKTKDSQTFVMIFEGRMYVPAIKRGGKLIMIHKHIDPKFVSDKEAIDMLKLGALNESHFKVLPKGYKTETKPESSKKTFTIEDLEKVLENGKFNQMRAVVNELKINSGKNPKSAKLKESIKTAISKMKEQKEAEK